MMFLSSWELLIIQPMMKKKRYLPLGQAERRGDLTERGKIGNYLSMQIVVSSRP
jgi:hypothetical protein